MLAHQEYEFLGPLLGPVSIMIGLPAVCYGLVYACNSDGCLSFRNLSVPGLPPQTQLISSRAFLAILGWAAFQTILHLVLPGKHVQGTPLVNGQRLKYKLNGALGSCILHVNKIALS